MRFPTYSNYYFEEKRISQDKQLFCKRLGINPTLNYFL